MSLTPGTRIGAYEVVGLLGTGGMGEVYRARDTRLGRDVALKILPVELRGDADRLARFEREARALAALNHPNIAQIYGVVELDSTPAIAMELVDGDDLAVRLARGPMPTVEALLVARQIADALEAAHESNLIHRDLKPANVKLRADGTVKVLDFGLAKALAPEGASATAEAMGASTRTRHDTQHGVIVGTAAYMSPEQAKGLPVDQRTDIWAFGCVLFEMLAGRRAFEGDTLTEILAAVTRDEPKFELLPRDAAQVVPLLRRALKKDLRRRTRHIGDVRLELEESIAAPVAGPADVLTSRSIPSRRALIAAAVLTTAALIVGFWAGLSRRDAAVPFRFQVSYVAPDIGSGGNSVGAISPDGTHHAFPVPEGVGQALFIRNFQNGEVKRVPGSEGAVGPFWSPDGIHIAFFAGNRLMRTDRTAQPAAEIATVGIGSHRGGTWNSEDVILFAKGQQGIRRVSAKGGEVTSVVEGRARDDAEQTPHYPEFLPDGQHFVFLTGDIANGERVLSVGALDGTAPVRLFASSSSAAVVPGPALLFVRDNQLLIQRLDSDFRAIGGTSVVADDVDVVTPTAAAQFTVGGDVLLYRTRSTGIRFQWANAHGLTIKEFKTDEIRTAVSGFSLAPTDDRLTVSRVGPHNAQVRIWMLTLQTAVLNIETTGPDSESWPCWDPDGKQLAFHRAGQLVIRTVGGLTPERTLPFRGGGAHRCVWIREGIVVHRGRSLVLVNAATGAEVRRLLNAANVESVEGVSADGKLAAVVANNSGRPEVFVLRVDGTGSMTQVSRAGGRLARWSRSPSVNQLFFISGESAWMTTISGKDLTASELVSRFSTTSGSDEITGWDIARDGRFLLSVKDRQTALEGVKHWRLAIEGDQSAR